MIVVRGYTEVPQHLRGGVLTIGNFDGVHRGHQALVLEAKQMAAERVRPAGAMVFEPHPRQFFRPERPLFRLNTLPRKLELLSRLGLDFTAVIDFDAALSKLDAIAFIDEVLVKGFAVSHVVIGYDFFFGCGRTGNPKLMRVEGAARGFGVSVVEPVAEAGEVFSSSEVRAKLSEGDVRGAAQALGHWWRTGGVVTGGAKRGTAMGFPTANVRLAPGTALGHGIYAVRIYLGDARYLGAAYLGTRPTFDDGPPVLETFLFDFDGDLYGREIEVEFIDFVRPDQRFKDMDALVAQMTRDCAKARDILEAVDRADPMGPMPLSERT